MYVFHRNTLVKLFILLTSFSIFTFYSYTFLRKYTLIESVIEDAPASSFFVTPFGNHTFLLDLSKLNWPPIQSATKITGLRLPSGEVAPLPPAFEPVMSVGQRNLTFHLLLLFSNLMYKHGWGDRFMLHGATLLGSFRHHDLIPWDDDLDLLVDNTIRPALQKVLSNLGNDYLLVKQSLRDKFCTRPIDKKDANLDLMRSRKTSNYEYGWPFLDISYYIRNKTHVNEIARAYGRSYSWLNTYVFPLYYRPLGKYWFPSPRDPLKFLTDSYDETSECRMFGYSHVLEAAGPSGSVSCSVLGTRYAFVQHGLCSQPSFLLNPDPDEMVMGMESLVLVDERLHKSVIHSICLPVPYHNTQSVTYGFMHKK